MPRNNEPTGNRKLWTCWKAEKCDSCKDPMSFELQSCVEASGDDGVHVGDFRIQAFCLKCNLEYTYPVELDLSGGCDCG